MKNFVELKNRQLKRMLIHLHLEFATYIGYQYKRVYSMQSNMYAWLLFAASIMPSTQKSFNVDNIRVCKILGQGIHGSQVLNGMVFKRQVEGDVNKAEKCKVAVFSCPLDLTQTETKVSYFH